MTEVELRTTAMAVGGEAVAREASGRVVFLAGALPGELVAGELEAERKTYARGHAVSVLEPSADRVEPPCPHVAEGCGGCDWQHVALDAQRRIRRDLVVEVLERSKAVVAPVVELGPAVPAERVRTTVRGVADADGRFSLRRRRSHDPIAVEGCLIAHPLVGEVIDRGWFPPGANVQIRAGARTGERLVVVGPSARGVEVPADVQVVGDDELRKGHRAWIHEEAGGVRWRVSADSFFQASADGADALVAVVGAHLAAHAPDAARLVDLCCGVGLFAGTVGAGRSVVGVERSAAAVADARVNLEGVDAKVIKVALGRWRPSPADVVVADPARAGLGAEGVAAVAATGAQACTLVSCDPAALGRDAALLAEAGFAHVGSTVLDLFGHSSHIEVVSTFVRTPPEGPAR